MLRAVGWSASSAASSVARRRSQRRSTGGPAYSLQRIMSYKIHAGGITALGDQGYRHYLPLEAPAPVWLYGDDIPSWLPRLKLDAPLITRRTSLFTDPDLGLIENKSASALTTPWGWALRMSSPERALLEVLDELPAHESFHNLDMVFEGLATLSPRRLTALLQSCRKIKVRRLFLRVRRPPQAFLAQTSQSR